MKHILLASGIGLLLAGVIFAQETPKFAFNLGGGFTEPVGGTGSQAQHRLEPGRGRRLQFHLSCRCASPVQ